MEADFGRGWDQNRASCQKQLAEEWRGVCDKDLDCGIASRVWKHVDLAQKPGRDHSFSFVMLVCTFGFVCT